jgi:hypothetical protein
MRKYWCIVVLLLLTAMAALGQAAKPVVTLKAKVVPAGPGSPPSVGLSWIASPTSGVSYNVYDAATAGGEVKPALANVIGATTYTDTTLAFGMARFYVIRACSGCKPDGTGGAESTPTNEVSVQIPLQPLPPGTLAPPTVLYP